MGSVTISEMLVVPGEIMRAESIYHSSAAKRHKKLKIDLIEPFVLFVRFVAYNTEPSGPAKKVNYV